MIQGLSPSAQMNLKKKVFKVVSVRKSIINNYSVSINLYGVWIRCKSFCTFSLFLYILSMNLFHRHKLPHLWCAITVSFSVFCLFLSASWCGQRVTFICRCPLEHKHGTLGTAFYFYAKIKEQKYLYSGHSFCWWHRSFPLILSLMRSHVAICWQRTGCFWCFLRTADVFPCWVTNPFFPPCLIILILAISLPHRGNYFCVRSVSYLRRFESENHLHRKFSFQISIGLVLIKEINKILMMWSSLLFN